VKTLSALAGQSAVFSFQFSVFSFQFSACAGPTPGESAAGSAHLNCVYINRNQNAAAIETCGPSSRPTRTFSAFFAYFCGQTKFSVSVAGLLGSSVPLKTEH
jgi:hypothetical protein